MGSPKNVTTYSAVLGAVLAQSRDEKKLTQQDLAKAVGVSGSTWSRIEKGSNPVTTDQLRRAAKALGMSGSEVLNLAEQNVGDLNTRGIEVREIDSDSVKGLEQQLAFLVAAGSVPIIGPVLVAIIAANMARDRSKAAQPASQRTLKTKT